MSKYILLFSTVGSVVTSAVNFDRNLHCNEWASVDNECAKNPRYMWSSCLSSCLEHVKDADDDCAEFAAVGECLKNPVYVQVNCPVSCGLGVAWNPWVRRDLGIEKAAFLQEIADETCEVPSDLFAAAELMKSRINKFLSGGQNSVKGLQSSAPSEFLGVYGLYEAILYTLRLYEVTLHHSPNTDGADILEETKQYIGSTIREVLTLIENSGYSGDTLNQNILHIYHHNVVPISDAIHEILNIPKIVENEEVSQTCRAAQTVTSDSLAAHFRNLPTATEDVQETVADANGNTVSDTITLSNGLKMPVVGLGTWQLEYEECEKAVYEAIQTGYRLFDTAEAYRNEAEVGNAIAKAINDGLVTRADIFIASKISNPEHAGYVKVKNLIKTQLQALQTDYIDLYMLHSPLDQRVQAQTWKALEELYDEGVLKSIGVSNFNEHELRDLIAAARIKPMIIQNKVDVYHYGKQLDNIGDSVVSYAASQGVVVQAYSPLASYPFVMSPVEDPIVKFIAANHKRDPAHPDVVVTAAQILLRWSMQHGMIVIPRSSNKDRLAENYNSMKIQPLTKGEMNTLDSLQYLIASGVSKAINIEAN